MDGVKQDEDADEQRGGNARRRPLRALFWLGEFEVGKHGAHSSLTAPGHVLKETRHLEVRLHMQRLLVRQRRLLPAPTTPSRCRGESPKNGA
jgi:hypothetical protein